MKIEINLKIILFIILLMILNRIDIYMLFIVFILCHELAHMIFGMFLGFKPKTLQLNPLGVSIEFYNYDENTKYNRIKRIFTYLAGPIANFIFCIIFYFMNIDLEIKTKIIYTNLLIGIFNLIPMLPLDGGKVLKEVLKFFYNPKIASIFMIHSTKSILIAITLIYSIAIFYMRNIVIFLLIVYLWYLYIIEEKKERLIIRVYETIENKRKYKMKLN